MGLPGGGGGLLDLYDPGGAEERRRKLEELLAGKLPDWTQPRQTTSVVPPLRGTADPWAPPTPYQPNDPYGTLDYDRLLEAIAAVDKSPLSLTPTDPNQMRRQALADAAVAAGLTLMGNVTKPDYGLSDALAKGYAGFKGSLANERELERQRLADAIKLQTDQRATARLGYQDVAAQIAVEKDKRTAETLAGRQAEAVRRQDAIIQSLRSSSDPVRQQWAAHLSNFRSATDPEAFDREVLRLENDLAKTLAREDSQKNAKEMQEAAIASRELLAEQTRIARDESNERREQLKRETEERRRAIQEEESIRREAAKMVTGKVDWDFMTPEQQTAAMAQAENQVRIRRAAAGSSLPAHAPAAGAAGAAPKGTATATTELATLTPEEKVLYAQFRADPNTKNLSEDAINIAVAAAGGWKKFLKAYGK